MAKKASGNQNSTVAQSNAPPPQFMQAYQNLVSNAQGTAARPYTPYGGQMVAGFNPMQNQAFGMIQNSANLAAPYINQAGGIFSNNANSNLWGQLPQLNAADINQYLNPFTQDVTRATEAQFANLNAQQQSGLIGNAINSGAFGGDRAAVAQGILGGQQAAQEAPILAGIQERGFGQALQTAQQQQGAHLGALEAQGWLGAQSAFGLGQLGGEAQNLGESGAQSILGAGNMQQQLAQEQLNIPFYQYQAQQAYPFQTQNWLANIVEGTGSLAGGSGTTQTFLPNTSNPASGIMGGALSGAAIGSMFGPWGAGIGALGGGLLGGFMRRGGAILPRGIPIARRAPGGGIFDYAPGGGGSDSILGYAPNVSPSMRGRGPPMAGSPMRPTPRSGPGGQLSSILPMLAMANRGSAGGGPGMGTDLNVLSNEAMANVGAGAPGLRRGGGIFTRGYDDGGPVDDMDITSPEIGIGAVPLRYVQRSPLQDPAWPGRSGPPRPPTSAGPILMDDPRITDQGNYALEGDMPDERTPSRGILPSKESGPYGYEGYTAPDHARDTGRMQPWQIGMLGAGLGILSHGTRQRPLAGADEGVRAYMQSQTEQDRQSEREAEEADAAAYKKANLKREGEQFSQNVDLSKQKLKQAGAQHDEQMQIARERNAQTSAHQTAEEQIARQRVGIEGRNADAMSGLRAAEEARQRAELNQGTWETGTQKDATTGEAVSGSWFTPRYGGNPTFHPGVDMTGGRGSRGETASQWKYQAWLSAHPGDEQGALDFVGGHKQMGEGDIAKAAHGMAQGDYKTLFGTGERPPPRDAEGWLSDRRAQYEQQLRVQRQPQQQQTPAMQPYPPMEQRVAGKTSWVAPSGQRYRWNGSAWDEVQ